ncbi:hypothetical protein AYL99_09780 [Fonsecaea erecta]|uniref:Uncharacterized protein n=1 Tax=Fonsecaea erecta TaxID=1367422 RepID=A0A178Z769_9EURO|nr:hypothetical protein AYL99_09780 [Fonsecaea erecta]OAP55628.1 hypothetical protein AYL99_09780 [Fonsecaea erecta]
MTSRMATSRGALKPYARPVNRCGRSMTTRGASNRSVIRELKDLNKQLVSLVGLVGAAVDAVDQIRTVNGQREDMRCAVATAMPARPACQTRPPEDPEENDLPVDEKVRWLPPGNTPSLIYLGRALDQNDLTVVHSWYRRLESRVRNHARYSIVEYHRLLGNRNRVEIRESLPHGFLDGWVRTHWDDAFSYYAPAVPAAAWPVQLKLHINPSQYIFIVAIVFDDNVGPRPCQDPNILQAFYPANVTTMLDLSSLFWEKAQLLSQTRDLDKYAGAILEISTEFRTQWDEASSDLSDRIYDAPRQKALMDMVEREKRVSRAVVAVVENPAKADQLWEKLATVVDQGREEWAVASYVLRGAICHQLSSAESINTDPVKMFEDPFTGALLA